MKKSESKPEYLKIQTREKFKSYEKQINFCRLYNKWKKYYNLIAFQNINDNKRF